MRYTKAERVGVNAVEQIIVGDLGWIFREQPIADMGIDAHIELVQEGKATGQLIALQIKTGLSHFRVKSDAYIYYGDLSHLDYWLSHSLPVILVAHILGSGETAWVHVGASAVTRTKKRWRIAIPKNNVLGSKTASVLEELFAGTPSQQRLRRLTIDQALMRHIKGGNKVSVGLEDWVNKSLGRTTVEVFVSGELDEEHSQKWPIYFAGYGMRQVAEKAFPWASASIDEEFYDENCEFGRGWEEERDRAADVDNGIISEPGADIDEDYPYAVVGSGEVELYRFKLDLNELGESFLVVSDYLDKDEKR